MKKYELIRVMKSDLWHSSYAIYMRFLCCFPFGKKRTVQEACFIRKCYHITIKLDYNGIFV